MKFKKFWKAFSAKEFGKDDVVVMHFRIGTSGKMRHPDCTHPFPVCDDYEHMNWKSYTADSICVHNGVVGSGDGDASDTMVAIKDYINPMFPYMEDPKIAHIMDLLVESKSSRWLITNKANVIRFGKWITSEGGVKYSNLGYLPTVTYNWQNGRAQGHPWNGYGRYGAHESNGYDWDDTELKIINTIYSFTDYAVGGVFSWVKFNEYMAYRKEQLAHEFVESVLNSDDGTDMQCPSDTDDTEYESDGFTEVFDKEGKEVVAVVDDNGDIVWDDQPVPEGVITVYNSPVGRVCPECGEEKHVVDSNFTQGDYLCCRCGAVFTQPSSGKKGRVLLWDINIRKDFDTSQKQINGDK